jgi:hypothetical protein
MTPAVPAPTGAIQVYILTGQSNSLGTTNLEGSAPATYGPGAHAADASTALVWSNVRSTNTIYPPLLYGDSGGAALPLQMQQGDGGANPSFWGPEFGLARALHDAGPGEGPVLVIKASRSGGGNTLWHRPSFDTNPNFGHMWGHLRDTVDSALSILASGPAPFRVRGLLYLQGESNNSSEAAVADVRIAQLASELEGHIEGNYPGVATGLSVVIGEIAASNSSSNRELTTARQMELAAASPGIGFVRTADLPLKADNIHFGRQAKLTIGQRFAEALLGTSKPFNIGNYDASDGAPIWAVEVSNPTQSGFTEIGAGPGVVLEGVIDGVTPAWRVADNSTGLNPGYQRSLGTLDFKGMYHAGWTLRARVKVLTGGGLALWSVTQPKDPGWGVSSGPGNMNGFLVDAVGANEFRVSLWGNSAPPVQLGANSAASFHTLELRGVPGTPLCNFHVDGVLMSSGLDITQGPGLGGYGDIVLFNSGQTGGTGREVYWAEVSLTSEPMGL